MARSRTLGFTLIELMIAVVIIGILSAIAYPAYQGYTQKSRRSDAVVALTKLANRQEQHYADCNTYTNVLVDPGGGATGCAKGLDWGVSTSEQGYYNLTLSGASTTAYTLQATAVGIQAGDTSCATFTLASTGSRTPAACW